MDDATRQQRRKLQREQVKTGRGLFAAGLAVEPRRPEVIAVAAVLRSKLAERDNDHRASEAAGLAQSLCATSLKKRPGKLTIACKAGCSYCCHGFVGVMPPEAFRVADAVRAGRAGGIDAETVRIRSEPLRGLAPDARIGRKLPCPLLKADGLCGVYTERPLVCRQATSLSLPSCIEEFEGLDPGGRVEISSVHLAHSSNAHAALQGAMLAVGLPTEAYEFSAALTVALADPRSERRWLDGEDIFAGLSRHVRRPPEVEMVVRRIAEEIRG